MTLPLTQALKLPLPKANTQIVGIFQSDIIIRTAIEMALADMRANPWLLDYVFASLPQDQLTWKTYGQKELDQAKKWFLTTDVKTAILPRFDESKWPLITIELLESSEVTSESTHGDVNYNPWEDNGLEWPDLTPKFTPKVYNPTNGFVQLPDDTECGLFSGMFIVDRNGQAHEIIEVISSSSFKIAPMIADFRGAVIRGHKPNFKVSVESSSFKESYRIGIHVQNESIHLTWMHAILQFALMRYKQVLLEGRGFERSTVSSSQVGEDSRFETENIFTRFITISGYVRQFWPKIVGPVIDGVEMDAIQVSGVGGLDVMVRGTGVDPDEQLWVGNRDTIRRR